MRECGDRSVGLVIDEEDSLCELMFSYPYFVLLYKINNWLISEVRSVVVLVVFSLGALDPKFTVDPNLFTMTHFECVFHVCECLRRGSHKRSEFSSETRV